jgi:zinc protease
MTALRRHAGFLAGLVLLLLLVLHAVPSSAVEIQRVAAGGVEAWLVEDRSNPVVSVALGFRGGAAADPADKAGLTTMAVSLLDEGAGDLDSRAFQDRLRDLAIELRFDAGRDAVRAEMRTLSENRDAAFSLLGLALRAPRFDPEPVARVRSQLQAALRRSAEDPDQIADRRLFATLFPDHPYGRPVEGTIESLNGIDREDLAGWSAGRLVRDTLVIGVVGDVDADALARLLELTFADLPAGGPSVAVPEVLPVSGETVVVDMPAPQSAIVFGQRGLRRDDPDYYALTVVNQAIGGSGLTSRLFDEVREKRGLAYGVSTHLLPLDRAGLIVGNAGTANERAGETLAVIREQWRLLSEHGLSEPELDDAKSYLIGSFPLRLTSSGRIAGLLVSIRLDDLGIDYLERRHALIEAVTLDDVNRVARALFDPGALTIVVAGQPHGIFWPQ